MAKMIYIFIAICYVAVRGESDQKKTSQRDVNDAEVNADYSLAKIPVYVIPNTPPVADGKIPIAVIPSAYLNNNAVKDKPLKYGFYAPYKTPKVTPIHEPQNEGFVPLQPSEAPLAYAPQDLYQRTQEYEGQHSAYKTPASNSAYIKYEQPKALLPKQQSLSNNNAYASLAPVYSYPSTANAQHPVNVPAPKKFTTYDAENNVQIQYVIKYVPVPYTVASSNDQYQNAAPEQAYVTQKPAYLYKDVAKKPSISAVHHAQPINPAQYSSSTENYVDYGKYAETYTPTATEEQTQYPLIKTYNIQPNYKFYDKNAYTKKYTPVSYVLASIGKAAPTHYAATIRHDSPEHDPLYTTKLAPVPLPVDKYTAQDNFKPSPVEDVKTYPEQEYTHSAASLYSLPNNNGAKYTYKSSLVAPEVPQFYNYEHGSPFQYQSSGYQKKDVSASISSGRSTESSTGKQS